MSVFSLIVFFDSCLSIAIIGYYNIGFNVTNKSKCFWIPKYNWIGATGFSRTAKREIKLWDLRDMSKVLLSKPIDVSVSILMPYYDNDINVLYCWNRGNTSIRYDQIVNDDQKIYPLSVFRRSQVIRGGTFVPKRCLNVWKCEVARFLRLEKMKKCVVPISFVVSRKNGDHVFQSDLYPKTLSGESSMVLKQYMDGVNIKPNVMSMNPNDYLDWIFVRVIWIAFHKNKTNKDCLIDSLPKDVVKLILTFVGIKTPRPGHILLSWNCQN